MDPSRPSPASTAPHSAALWCLVGAGGLLVRKGSVTSLDRAAWMLPRFAQEPQGGAALRKQVDEFLSHAGLDSIRRPMIDLGDVLAGDGPQGHLVRMFALALDEPPGLRLQASHALVPITRPAASLEDLTRPHMAVDALAWAGAHLYFSRPESTGRPRDYEMFASLPIHLLRDDYLNLWFPEAARELEPLGMAIEIDATESQPVLRVHGRHALREAQIFMIRARLSDLARHAHGRFWVTEIVDGEESLQDFADPAVARTLHPAALSS